MRQSRTVGMILIAIAVFLTFPCSVFCDDALVVDGSGKVGIGKQIPGESLDVVGNVKATGDICTDSGNCLNSLVPSGVIVMWSGTIASIPSGWALCDGNNGTPNLTDRFIIHADADDSGTHNTGETGGSKTITISNLPAHTHEKGSLTTIVTGDHAHHLVARSSNTGTETGNGYTHGTYQSDRKTMTAGAHSHSISGTTGSTGSGTVFLPQYYALAFIMKI